MRQYSLYRALKNASGEIAPSERQTRPMRPSAGGKAPRILLVEDHLYSQKLTTQILSRLGYRVSTASNGLKAVELLRVEDFDLVLMDIQMPVMDGLSAARTVRNPESGTLDPDIPIIALTLPCLRGGQAALLPRRNERFPAQTGGSRRPQGRDRRLLPRDSFGLT